MTDLEIRIRQHAQRLLAKGDQRGARLLLTLADEVNTIVVKNP